MSGDNTEDYIWALQRIYNLLRADKPIGALARLPAGGVECEELVEKAVAECRDILRDDLPE